MCAPRHWCPVRWRVAQRPRRHLLWPTAVIEKKPKPCEATAVNAAATATVVAGFIASRRLAVRRRRWLLHASVLLCLKQESSQLLLLLFWLLVCTTLVLLCCVLSMMMYRGFFFYSFKELGMRSVCTDGRLLFNWRDISVFLMFRYDNHTYAFDSLY